MGKTTPARLPWQMFERRRRWRRRMTWLTLIIALTGLAWIDHARLLLYPGSDMARYDRQTFDVVHVVDGDTLDVADERGAITRVRLWGVDTPELAKPHQNQPDQPWAQQARQFTLALAQGQTVTLHLEAHRTRGTFGRLLAHVELPDHTLLNTQLVAAGWATSDKRWSHRHFDHLNQLQRQAKQNKIGQWTR